MSNIIDDKKEVTLEEITIPEILTAKKSTPITGNVRCPICNAIIDKDFNTDYWGVDDATYDEPDSDEFSDIMDENGIEVIHCPYCGHEDYANRWYQAYTDDIIDASNCEELFPGITAESDKEIYNESYSIKEGYKMTLEEATLKALYSGLDDSENVKDVEGLVDDVLVVTDPEINTEEYNELIDRAQEIVEDTPEGDIPFDESYLGQFLQTCPICGSTFAEDHMLEPGATCPICFEQPESFVVLGQVALESDVAEDNGVAMDGDTEEDAIEDTVSEVEDIPATEEPEETLKGKESVSISDIVSEKPVNASKEITSTGTRLTESEATTDRYSVYIFEDDMEDDADAPVCTIYDNSKDGFYFDAVGMNPIFDSEAEAEKYIADNKLNG